MASVTVEHVWKRFLLQKDRADSVGQLLWRMVPGRSRRPRPESFWALQDVSFEMPSGTSLGIIGSNGSGKSTMLKLLTRTMQPTSGNISVRGKVSALIELGAGFHPDFTGRENIVLSASILGIRRQEIERRMDEVIDFAGIRQFIDTPVKYYSSGMQARLGFSVAIHVEPEILIVDEVLSVGDEAFGQKCMERIFQMKRAGISILLVSHDLGSIERLMDRAVWIERGIVRASGPPRQVVQAYRAEMPGSDPGSGQGDDAAVTESRSVLGLNATRISSADEAAGVVATGAPAELTFEFTSYADHRIDAQFAVSIRRPDGLELMQISTFLDGFALTVVPGPNRITLSIAELSLTNGTYEIDATVSDEAGRRLAMWSGDPRFQFQVRSANADAGLIAVAHRWSAVGSELQARDDSGASGVDGRVSCC